MGFTRSLVERALSIRFEAIPPAALHVAKTTLLDTMGVALAGSDERVARAVRALVASEVREGPASIWGTTERASAARAALANGTAAHALDYDDVCWAMNAHPSAVLWPTALAVGEAQSASGAAALVAYVAGFEAAADLGSILGNEHYAAGFHPTVTIGTIAATITAGKLLELGDVELRRAVGIASSRVSGTRLNFGTDTKPLHAGLAAEAGIMAASLAKLGVTACENAIEGPMGIAALYRGESTGSPRSGYALIDPGVELKPYPSCRFTHRIIDAALAIRARHPTKNAASIECTVDPFSPSVVIYSRPTTGLEAKFSMEYAAAVALLDGGVGVDAFTDARVAKDDVQRLLRQVTVTKGSGSGSAKVETLRVRFSDGAADEESVHVAKGSPSKPLSRAELANKFRMTATGVLGARTAAVEDAVERFESLSNVGILGALLR